MCGITQKELKEILSYDPEKGNFTWLVGKMAGKKAAALQNKDYIHIKINTKFYLAHRLAWLYVNGRFPNCQIDHINGIINDNRIANLRECSNSENNFNVGIMRTNTSGFKGVSWHKASGNWRAQINIDGRIMRLGGFATAELASEAYQTKAREFHGEFYRETAKDLK